MNLGVTVMATGDAVISTGGYNLIKFNFAIGPACLGVSGLQKSAAAAAAVVIGFVRSHFDKILFTDNRLNDEPQIVRHLVAIPFPNDLAGILNSEFDAKILIPVGIYF